MNEPSSPTPAPEPTRTAVPSVAAFFSPGQRRVVAASMALVAGVLLVATLGAIFFLLQRVVGFFSGVIWPLAIAGILALLLRPVVLSAERRLKLTRSQAVVLIYGVFVVVLGAGLAALVPLLFDQALTLGDAIPALGAKFRETLAAPFPEWLAWTRQHLSDAQIEAWAAQLGDGIREFALGSMPALREAGGWVSGLFGLLAATAIIPIYLWFFLLSDRDPLRDLDRQIDFVPEGYRADLIFLVREFVGILVAFFHGQILIGLLMGVLLSVGFHAVGLSFGILLGAVVGLLNIVPYLGTILGLGFAIPIAFLQAGGGPGTVAAVLGVFVAVQLLEGYVLTPRIMGDKTGLHPLAIIIAIFFWGTAFDGLIGMVLAIPLTAFFVVAWRLLRRKYLHRKAGAVAVAADSA